MGSESGFVEFDEHGCVHVLLGGQEGFVPYASGRGRKLPVAMDLTVSVLGCVSLSAPSQSKAEGPWFCTQSDLFAALLWSA